MAGIDRRPRIFLLVPCFMPHDAVGNDVYGMYQLLRTAGYDVSIFAADFHKTYESITTPLPHDSECWNSPDDILIYHHAVGWPLGESMLARARNKIVIKYHNITPARFYEQYSQNHYNVCLEGELSTRRMARIQSAMFWGDSQFNMEELISHGAPRDRCNWIPPCHLTEELRKVPMDPHILGTLRDGRRNILFVGGMRPNKGHALALHAYAAYRHIYNQQARLIFCGSYDASLSAYLEHIRRLSRQLEVESEVVFAHSVSPAQLKTFYYVADVFLCVSEHEGFCVPLAEAMSFRVPILALGQTAVPETVGGAGMVHDHFDPMLFAGSLDQVHRNPQQCLETVTLGRLRYERAFHPQAIRRKFLTLLEDVETAPHA